MIKRLFDREVVEQAKIVQADRDSYIFEHEGEFWTVWHNPHDSGHRCPDGTLRSEKVEAYRCYQFMSAKVGWTLSPDHPLRYSAMFGATQHDRLIAYAEEHEITPESAWCRLAEKALAKWTPKDET